MRPASIINVQSIQKSFGATPLFTDISMNLYAEERMELIGPNGSGKSTFLKVLAGLEPLDSGEISRKQHLNLIYLPQTDEFSTGETVRDILMQALPNQLEDWEVRKRIETIQRRLEFEDLKQPVRTLSGGWRKRLAIGRALLQAPDMLLLDEPTNHLDLEGILWLEKLLQNPPFAFVLVSHDRFFVDKVANRLLMFEDGAVREFNGNWTLYQASLE